MFVLGVTTMYGGWRVWPASNSPFWLSVLCVTFVTGGRAAVCVLNSHLYGDICTFLSLVTHLTRTWRTFPHTPHTFISIFFTFLSFPVIIRFIKVGYTIVTVRGKDSEDQSQPIGFGSKNTVPLSTVYITGAGKTATAALYTLRLSTTKVFIYTSLLFKQNRSVNTGRFCCIPLRVLSWCLLNRKPFQGICNKQNRISCKFYTNTI